MLPSHVDGGFHAVSQDNELGRPAVVIGSEANNMDLSHSERNIAGKPGESKKWGSGTIRAFIAVTSCR